MNDSVASGTPKLDWGEAPGDVRAAVESLMGAPVVASRTMPGGFNPGVAARLVFDDGSRAFVKSVAESVNRASADMHRREAVVVEALASLHQVPNLIGSFDKDGWVTLVFEDVDGRHPRLPWQHEELTQVLDAHHTLAQQLTPAPLAADSLAGSGDEFESWEHFVERPDLLDSLGVGWARSHLDELLKLQAQCADALVGDTLLHADLRADQILLADDTVVFVDWPHACTGPAWADVVMMVPSIVLQGGPEPEELIAASPAAQSAPLEDVRCVAAALAGGFLWYSTKPPPPGLPTVRAFQRAQGTVLLEWVRRTGRTSG